MIRVEAIEQSGVVLTVAELPRLVIFGEKTEDALLRAREAIAFQLDDPPGGDQHMPLELVLGELTIGQGIVNGLLLRAAGLSAAAPRGASFDIWVDRGWL